MRKAKLFTLIELLIVIVVIMILAGILLSAGGAAVKKSEQDQARNMIRTIETGLIQFKMDKRYYPVCAAPSTISTPLSDEAGNALLGTNGSSNVELVSKIYPDYIDKKHLNSSQNLMIDPWGTVYCYRTGTTNKGDYDIATPGPDGFTSDDTPYGKVFENSQTTNNKDNVATWIEID